MLWKYLSSHSKDEYEKVSEEKGLNYICSLSSMDFSQGHTVTNIDTIHLNSVDCLINLDMSIFTLKNSSSFWGKKF